MYYRDTVADVTTRAHPKYFNLKVQVQSVPFSTSAPLRQPKKIIFYCGPPAFTIPQR